MKLAFYKGPPTDSLRHKLGHWLVCVGTGSHYSHVELVIGDVCWSSSYMDGGVRAKRIDLTSGKWDVMDIEGDEQKALAWFTQHQGEHYDWPGVLRFVLPFIEDKPGEYFCSEAVAAALGIESPNRITPQDLFSYYSPTAPV